MFSDSAFYVWALEGYDWGRFKKLAQRYNRQTLARVQVMQSNQLTLPQQDDWKTRKDTKNYTTKQGPNTKLTFDWRNNK